MATYNTEYTLQGNSQKFAKRIVTAMNSNNIWWRGMWFPELPHVLLGVTSFSFQKIMRHEKDIKYDPYTGKMSTETVFEDD